MKIFIDCEFIENGITIDLISIALVCEDGRIYYACNDECNLSKASDWVKENVLPGLPSKHLGINPDDVGVTSQIREEILTWKTKDTIAKEIVEFVFGTDERPTLDGYLNTSPEFWGWYCDYDHVVFCQLFGTMMDLPQGFPMYMRDLKQTVDELGNPKLPKQIEGIHNALLDAKWIKDSYFWLKQNYIHPAFDSEVRKHSSLTTIRLYQDGNM